MTFTRANALGWALYEQLTSTQMNHVDLNQSRALDGFAGGTYNPSAEVILAGQRLGGGWVKVIPRASAPASPEEGDIWRDSGSPRKTQEYVNGAWRTIMAELTERQFQYPLECGAPDDQGHPTTPDWEWDKDYFWKKRAASGSYVTFGLGRFVPQGAEITQISVRWDPGAARPTQTDRMRMQLLHKTPPSGAGTVEETDYDDGTANEQWTNTGTISHTHNSDAENWWVEIRGGLDATADFLYALEIKYKDTEYMRVP